MRDYAIVSPLFWTGDTGRQIRAKGRDAQVVALYLLTCPSSRMLGIYYLPLPMLAHEVGITLQGASKALASLSEAHFAYYDEVREQVWVPEMARFQIAERLAPSDKRCRGVVKELEKLQDSPFYMRFLDRYAESFHLPRPSPFEGASEPLRCQDQDQDQDQDQKKKCSTVAAPPEFDFERVYAQYPRKQGRKRGLELCRSQIKTQQQYDRLLLAVQNYAAEIKRENTAQKYVKHFKTFMGCWEDHVGAAAPKANNIPSTASVEKGEEFVSQYSGWPEGFFDSIPNPPGSEHG